jgi:hypothetical protein
MLLIVAPHEDRCGCSAEGEGMPRTSAERPRLLSTPGEKIVALVLVALVAYLGLHWLQTRGSGGPERPGMTPATILKTAPAKDGDLNLTVRFTAGGKTHEITKPVDSAAFRAQGKIAWVCFKPGDASDAAIRLPQDELCGQK